MKAKRCWKCKQLLDIFNFHRCKTRKDGLHSVCKKCGSLFQQQYRYINRNMINKKANMVHKHNRKIFKYLLDDLKVNGCAICGYNKCNEALDFHHVNLDDKIFNIGSRGHTYSNKRIAEEINKCILLCANCHREIHKKGGKYEASG